MATLIESTSTTAALVDPYGGLHHRTSAIQHGTDDKCPPGGGDNGKLVAPKKNKSSSPQRRHLLAFQKNVRNNDNNNNNDSNDDEDDERKGHPISSASPAAARRRVENNMAKIFSSLASFILLFPRSLWSQLYSPQNFNDYKAKINQQQQQQQQHQSSQPKRCRLLLMAVVVIIATITLLPRWRLVVGESDSHSTIQSSLLSSALQHCSSSSSIQQLNQQQTTNSSNNIKSSLSSPSSSSSNKYILVASHLRAGSDGQLRLRIIEHNLRMLSYSTSSSSRAQQYSSSSAPEEEDHATAATIMLAQGDNEEDLQPPKKKMECTLIFSLDENYNTTICAMVQTWQNSILSSSNNNIISTSMNIAILYVPNDNIMVDASKWMIALYPLLPSIQLLQQDSRIMLINDSFLLTRPTPELWNPTICGSVCGLVWTGPNDGSDPTRHIQSYIRTLDYCALLRYMDFYERNKKMVHNVNELIVLFEINLDWAHQEPEGINGRGSSSWWSNSLLRGSSSGKSNGGDDRKEDNNRDVTAMYEYAGGHPDDEYAQHVLLTQNYPAIKLKKFFITDDPWLFAVLDKKDKANHTNITTTLSEEKEEEDLPPSFSTTIYRRTNHDLNHLSDNDLCKHFRTSGKYENRIYSNTLPLVMKGWLRIELERMMKEYDYIGVYNSQASEEEEEEDKWKGGGGVQRQADTTIAILDDYLVALNRDILGK